MVIGGQDLGPLAGGGARAIALADPEQFLRRAKLASDIGDRRNAALAHILKVEGDVMQAAAHLDGKHVFATTFPSNPFGNAVRTAARVIANDAGVAVVRLTLGGFDTHSNQAGTHARLLGDLAQGLVALKAALVELGRWDDTLVLSYAEFGRRPRENQSGGTDHGTANVHFALGGRVAGGFLGAPPRLDAVGDGNLPHAIDFRSVYATVLERWWDADARAVLGARFETLPLLRALSSGYAVHAARNSRQCGASLAARRLAHDRDFGGVGARGQLAAHQLEAQVEQVGVDDVGLAIAAHLVDPARRDRARDLASRPSRACRGTRRASPSRRAARSRAAGRRRARPSGRGGACGSATGSCST